ncbi:hypothetical protein L1887_56797 [Cichorium endivia]|nr:hypothetical protein L1887_56797 [Cichorium endivia]
MAKGGTGSESNHKPRWRQDLLAERELARRIHSVLRTRFDCNVCRESTQHSAQPDAHKERQVQPAEVECFACHGTCMSCSLPQPGTADAQTFGAYAHPHPTAHQRHFFPQKSVFTAPPGGHPCRLLSQPTVALSSSPRPPSSPHTSLHLVLLKHPLLLAITPRRRPLGISISIPVASSTRRSPRIANSGSPRAKIRS